MDAPGRQHDVAYWKRSFRDMIEKLGREDGHYYFLPELLDAPALDGVGHLAHVIQAERDLRRLGLHTIEEAVAGGLGLDGVRELVAFLIAESKDRQDEVERELNAICLPHVMRRACEHDLSLQPPSVQARVLDAVRKAKEER